MAHLILRHFADQGTSLLMVLKSPQSAVIAGEAVRRWHLLAHLIARWVCRLGHVPAQDSTVSWGAPVQSSGLHSRSMHSLTLTVSGCSTHGKTQPTIILMQVCQSGWFTWLCSAMMGSFPCLDIRSQDVIIPFRKAQHDLLEQNHIYPWCCAQLAFTQEACNMQPALTMCTATTDALEVVHASDKPSA